MGAGTDVVACGVVGPVAAGAVGAPVDDVSVDVMTGGGGRESSAPRNRENRDGSVIGRGVSGGGGGGGKKL